MVAILEKGEYNTDFHPMVDFIAASPLRRVRNAQSSALPTVADEPASLVRDVSEGEAYPIESGFIVDQDRATIANLQRQHSELLAKFQAQDVEILKLKDRVKVLEDREGFAATQSRDDALIKRRSIDEEEAATERISDDSEELARVLISMDATTVLAGRIDVPTGSGSIPTAGPPVVDIHTGSNAVPTASPIVATTTVIDAQVARELEEQQEREDKRMTKQIAKDAEVARIHAEEELQGIIDSLDRTNETIAKYLQEYQDFASELPLERRIELIRWKVKDFKGMTFKEIEAKFAAVWKLVEDFIPIGSKEEAERLKKKGFNLEQEKAKKQKTSKEVPDKEKSPEEIPKEKVKEMMQLVPIEEVYVQALQVKHPIINWKVHIEGQRSYWKII
nr:hypothetical protein [Tanacetum cinerariifolium]